MVACRRCCCLKLRFAWLAFGLLLTVLPGSAALAETAWFTCKVDMAGPGKIETFIALTDQAAEPAFSGKWFLFPAERAREMLAVALTAINGDKQVIVVVDPESATYPEITDIYLKAQ